jgi:tetratricopeptide (TPR) repeat protein
VRASLINEHQPGRFLFHDLVRDWSRDRSQTNLTAAEREAMARRLLDHHLQAARAGALRLDPFREDISPTAPSSSAMEFADYAKAFAWFDAEHPVLIALMVKAAATGFEAYVWRLAWALTDFLDRRGHWQHLVRIQELALTVAQDLQDQEGWAHTSRNLGHAHARLHSYDQAREHFLQAIDLFRSMCNRSGEAAVQLNVAWVFELQERYDTALAHATRSLELYEELADRVGVGRAANAVGWYQTLRGQHEQAVVQCRRALEVLSALGVRHDEAYTLESLGHAHHHLGQIDESIECYSRSLELLRDLGDSYYEAVVLRRLADTHLAANDEQTSRSLRARALSILDRLGHPDADGLRAELS